MCGELSAFFAELMPFCCFCTVRTLCRSALHLSCTLCPKRLTFYLLVPGVQPTLAVQLPHWHPLSLLTDWSDDHTSPALDLGALDMVCAFCLHRVQTENPDGSGPQPCSVFSWLALLLVRESAKNVAQCGVITALSCPRRPDLVLCSLHHTWRAKDCVDFSYHRRRHILVWQLSVCEWSLWRRGCCLRKLL